MRSVEPRLPREPVDVRLVALDMDGTLLDEEKRISPEFWPLVDEMVRRGIVVAPASGRQLATLRDQFADHAEQFAFVAENGTIVQLDGEVVSTDTVEPDVWRAVVRRVREAAAERDLGVVLCGVESAYIERTDAAFRRECDTYYHALAEVEDLESVTDGVLKLAIYDFEDTEHGAAPWFAEFGATHQVVVSGKHWLDIMNRGVDKGVGIGILRERLGLSRGQCVAFGDYLNDLEMLRAVDHSFAMANAHDDILAAARYVAPANTRNGVVVALRHLLRS